MKKFIIGYGLSGGFGGIQNYEVIEAGSMLDAENEAYWKACETYEQYAGSNGLRDISEIMEEDEVEEDEAEVTYNDERESWLDYVAYEYSEELEEKYSGYHFHNPFKD